MANEKRNEKKYERECEERFEQAIEAYFSFDRANAMYAGRPEVKPVENKVQHKKTYVQVAVDFYPDGRVRPTMIKWRDGRQFYIDMIKEIQDVVIPDAQPIVHYICVVWGRDCSLCFENNLKWFVSERVICA